MDVFIYKDESNQEEKMKNFEQNYDDYFDPANSEYTPLSVDVQEAIKNVSEIQKFKENTGIVASLIRKMLPA